MDSLPVDGLWAANELKSANFNDVRLGKRAIKILAGLSNKPQSSIPESFKSWSDVCGAYRFFDNEKVSAERILNPHYDACLARCSAFKVVLVAHDTSSTNHSGLQKTVGLGEVGDSKNKPNAKGLIIHTAYAVTPDRLSLGLLNQLIWSRETSKFKDPIVRKKAPIEQKESYKWLQSLKAVSERTSKSKDTQFIHVMDREADIFDVFSEAKDLEETFIIRARLNRRVDKKSRGSSDGEPMFTKLGKSKPLGQVSIEIPTRSYLEKKRQALVEVRAQQITVTAPRARSIKDHNFKNKSVVLTVISVNEIISEDVEPEDLINWTLLTNVPIKSSEEVLVCLDYYCCRWQIEVFHRILKTGCKVEDTRFSDARKISSYIALMSIVAWHFHWMNILARVIPKTSPDLVFTKKEQSVLSMLVLRKKPSSRTTLKDYLILLARLGGFLARKSDGMPGPEVLWRGWRNLKDAMDTLRIASEAGFQTYV